MGKMQFLRPDSAKQLILLKKTSSASVSAVLGRCEIFRFFTETWGKSSLGARLRTRKVTGRDASLPAPLLAASLGLVGRGRVGALPKPHKGRCPLTLQGEDEKGRSPPLTPFRDWIGRAFMLLPRAAFCASPKPLFAPPTFREEPIFLSNIKIAACSRRTDGG